MGVGSCRSYGNAEQVFWCGCPGAFAVDPRPDGSHPPPGPYVHDMEEIVAYVRAGRGVAYLPVPITATIAPTAVTFVRVDDIPPGQVVLAWDADRPPQHISGLVSAARSESEDTGPTSSAAL